jgi:hypothetical protein
MTGLSLALGVPFLVLAVVVAGEVHRRILRRRYKGAPPVEDGPASGHPASGHGASGHPAPERPYAVDLLDPVTTLDLRRVRYRVSVPSWMGERLVVAHLSDLHLNDALPDAYFDRVIEQVNAVSPDLIAVTGDFVSDLAYTPRISRFLSRLQGRLGVFAVLGNHDYWADAATIGAAVVGGGVDLLHNGCRRMPLQDGSALALCGYEAPWGSRTLPSPHAAEGDLTLVLTHTPDTIYRLRSVGAAAVFAGHNHAGQIRVPGFGPLIVPSIYGRRFDHGHFVVDGTHLFVTAGVGASDPALRLYCPPDIFVVEFIGGRLYAEGLDD